MGILLSWQLVVVLALFLIGFASSELELLDPVANPTSSDPRIRSSDKPLPIKISSVQHESFCVNIYDSQTTFSNKKIYFYSPITLLNNLNVIPISNQTVTQGFLSVRFSIWNEEIRNKVVQQLNQLLGQEIEPSNVKVLPYDSVRLTSKVQSADFSLTNEWLPYDNKPPLRFKLICPTREDCDRVKDQMRNNPEQFGHLRLQFKHQFNDDTCFSDDVKISQTDEMSVQVKELLANLEAKFSKELNAIREETKKNFAATSQMLADKIKNTEENLAVAQKKLEITEAALDSTRIELINTKSIVEDLTTKLNVVEDNLRKELGGSATSHLFENTTTNWASTGIEQQLRSTIAVVADLTTKLNSRTREIVDIGQMPTSCTDLHKMGQQINGFFLVKGLKKMETVYCNFHLNQNDLQKWIGYADVKSEPVHFYVQRYSEFDAINTPIPFNTARVNEGNAMDLTSGIFTAPRPGIYFFSFTGLANFLISSFKVWLGVSLHLNGNSIGLGHVEDKNTTDQTSIVTIQSTLNLKKGDLVWVEIIFKASASLFDNGNHHTHFTGFLLEEEIFASL